MNKTVFVFIFFLALWLSRDLKAMERPSHSIGREFRQLMGRANSHENIVELLQKIQEARESLYRNDVMNSHEIYALDGLRVKITRYLLAHDYPVTRHISKNVSSMNNATTSFDGA